MKNTPILNKQKNRFYLFFLQIVAIIIVPTSSLFGQQVFLTEGFESGSKPSTWSESKVTGSASWRYQDGGYGTGGYKFPAHAHTGSYNALFEFESPVIQTSRLITPIINLKFAIKPVLTFWHAQAEWAGNTDQLRVYYRPTATAAWVQLEEYLFTTPNWTERTIVLPAEAKTETCQLAFEGISKWGYGVCLDDIDLIERGVLPRQIQSIAAVQYQQPAPTGINDIPLGYISLEVSGNDGTLPINSINLTYTGTAATDIAANGFKLFYTRDTIFVNDAPLTPTGVSVSGGQVNFTGLSKPLQTGTNYIWVTASIATDAVPSNIVDYSIQANAIQIGTLTFPSTTLAPTQTSIVEESLLVDGFESNLGWTMGGIWQQGIPTGAGLADPTKAFAGTNILATNLNGNYPANITDPNIHIASTPTLNCKYYKDINVRFKQWLNFDYFDNLSLKVTSDGGTTWSPVWTNNTNEAADYWESAAFNIATLATRKPTLNVKFSIDSTNNNTEYGGWNIDNLAITGKFIAKDPGVASYSEPTVHCGMTTTEPVTVKIRNYGGKAITSSFQVGYSLNGGATYVKETITNPNIAIEGEMTYSFTQKANLSSPGTKNLVFKTFMDNDDDVTNDALSASIFVYPTVTIPYSTSFETSNSYWNSYGTNASWQWGIPAKPNIHTAYDGGTKVWVTDLTGNHSNNEQSYLETPCFNLTGYNFPVLSFYYKMQIQEGVDGFTIEYSIDNGTTWQVIESSVDYAQNWTPDPTISALGKAGWSHNTSAYVQAYTLLPVAARGQSGVKFRVAFASDASDSNDGVAIDGIYVYELPMDPSIEALTSPVSACEIGNNKALTFTIKNAGIKPISTSTTIPIKISVDGGAWVTENIVPAAIINQNGTMSYTTTATFSIRTSGDHSIKAYVDLNPDLNRNNDTLTATVRVKGMPDFTLGPDIGTTDATTVVLDAGAGMASYLWQDNTTTTQTFNVPSFGLYSVTVINGEGCEAKDTIEVVNSDKNAGVSAITGLGNSCTHSSAEKPTVTIKNFGLTPLATGLSIPIGVKVNNVVVATDAVVLASDLAPDATIDYTLTNGFDLSAKGEYTVSIYTNLPIEVSRLNDTTTIPANTFGLPTVNFEKAEIATTNPVGTILTAIASPNITLYSWKNETLNTPVGTNSTNYAIETSSSAIYSVTVTDNNACGTASASIAINAKDLGILSIDQPLNSICSSKPTDIKVTLKNFGQDTYASGSKVKLTYTTAESTNEEEFTFPSPIAPGGSLALTFASKATFDTGNNFVKITSNITGDADDSNNELEKSITVQPLPTVNIEPDTLYKVFGSTETYTILPNYSADVTDYEWQDLSTNDSYSIYGYPLFSKYMVIAKTSLGCLAKDSLVVISGDLMLSAIKSPINKCELGDNTDITITVSNSGSTTYLAGTKITVKADVNGTTLTPEEFTLLSDLAPQASIDYTLTQKANLLGQQNFSVNVTIEEPSEFVVTNNSLNKSGYASGYPTVSLGPDEVVHAWEKVLDPGNFKTYLWQDSSIEPTFTATTTGTYSVSVTDYNGCSASDEINLTFVVDDITLVSLDNPTSSCTLGNSEPVTITVKNTGTTTLASGSSIIVNFTLDGNTTNETVTLPTDLLPNATQQITLTSTMNFTTKKVYPIVVWVEMAGDMTAANNTINVSVEAYQLPVVNLGADFFQETKPAILDAGSGYTSYLWNTAETTQQISVNTAGNYSVTVTNANGCSATDDVNVTFASPDISLISLNNPTNSCALTGNETVTITVKNSGTATLPLGHPITVKYLMDGNTTSESTTLTSQLLPNATQQITLAGTMDFTVKKVYPIKIWVEMAGDIDANNDTINVSIEAYPAPVVNLGTDILVENPPATLDAGAGFASYLWNTTETTQQISVNTAGTYSVTVTDANGCSGSDQIVVTFAIPDIALISLDNPTTSCSLTSNEPVTVTVKNTGTATLPLGHPFTVKYTFDGNTTTEQVALTSQLIPNATQQITLAATMDFTNKKVYPIVVWVEMLGDDVSSNNTINVSVEAYQLPVVNLGTDIIQVNPPATLDAGAGFTSYLWNTGATTQQITATVSGNYSVTVTNNNGCAATDEINVRFTSQTLMVANLLTPFSQCVSNTTIPVAFEIINNGVSLLPAGTLIPMGYTFNSNPDVNESLSLASDLAVGSKQTLVFTQKVVLNTPGDNRLRIQLYKGLPEEQTSEFIFTGLPTPTFSFTKDTLDIKEFPYLISATGGNSYLWSTGSTASNTQVNAPGKYWVEVYGSNGCSVKDTIVIINTTTVGENEFITTLKYYPVPACYELNVETTLKATTNVTIEVLDVTGIARWRHNYGSVDRLTETIPLNDLKAGTYILRISTTEGISSNIFIINK